MFEDLLGEGSIKMVDMYSRLVKAGLRPIQKVPDQFRDAVMAGLTSPVIDENINSILTPTLNNAILHR